MSTKMLQLVTTQRVAWEMEVERHRQVAEEGYSPEHDDEHDEGQLAKAAAAYALAGLRFELPWPWPWKGFKPSDRRCNLVKAGALIIAEIERLDRAKEKEEDGDADQVD